MNNTHKWSVLLLRLAVVALVALGFAYLGVTYGGRLHLARNVLYAALAFVVAFGFYTLARRIGEPESLEQSRLGWSIVTVTLLPFVIGPLLSSAANQPRAE